MAGGTPCLDGGGGGLEERELTNLGRGAFVSRPSTGCIELKVLIEKEIERERENKK